MPEQMGRCAWQSDEASHMSRPGYLLVCIVIGGMATECGACSFVCVINVCLSHRC
jgi:hypothetical protein